VSYENNRTQEAVGSLLARLNQYWEPSNHRTDQNSLHSVRDIVHAAELSSADFAYLQAEAPRTVVQTDTDVYVDFSVLTEATRDVYEPGLGIEVLRTWHVLLLRSTFWSQYHEVYEQVGDLFEVNQHADALWGMVDPVFRADNQPPVTTDEAIRDTVVYRQILATRSPLSSLHPIDALARVCIPGYTERVHAYVQKHEDAVSRMLGITV